MSLSPPIYHRWDRPARIFCSAGHHVRQGHVDIHTSVVLRCEWKDPKSRVEHGERLYCAYLHEFDRMLVVTVTDAQARAIKQQRMTPLAVVVYLGVPLPTDIPAIDERSA